MDLRKEPAMNKQVSRLAAFVLAAALLRPLLLRRALTLILAALPALEDMPLAVAAWSGISATAAEYVTSLFYEKALRVSFWDYSGLTWNLHGRVCLGFSLCWCVLGLVVVYLIHPLAAYAAARLPGWRPSQTWRGSPSAPPGWRCCGRRPERRCWQ